MNWKSALRKLMKATQEKSPRPPRRRSGKRRSSQVRNRNGGG